MHPSSQRDVPDMTTLGELQECSILRNLLLRYKSDQIYVRASILKLTSLPVRLF